MSRKDYERIAAALAEQRKNIEATWYRRPDEAHRWFLSGWEVTARSVADALQADNPRFDRVRFEIAAGMR